MSAPSKQPRSRDRAAGAPKQTAAEARAEFEANRAANKAARQQEMDAVYGGGIPGRWILRSSWASTAVFTAVTVPAVIDPDAFVGVFFVVSVVLFFAGCALFFADIVLAAARSRDDLMGIGGLFLLLGSAPRAVQVHLLGALVVQIVVSIVGIATHPFTPLAFGTLVPILGLAACGFWSVRHGTFPPQTPDPDPAPRPRRDPGRSGPQGSRRA